MFDTYLKSKSQASLEGLFVFLSQHTPIVQGRAATTVNAGEENEETLPACGDSDYFYVCVRAPFEVPAYGDIEPCTAEEAVLVCGVIA